jgi:hypothetical protein
VDQNTTLLQTDLPLKALLSECVLNSNVLSQIRSLVPDVSAEISGRWNVLSMEQKMIAVINALLYVANPEPSKRDFLKSNIRTSTLDINTFVSLHRFQKQ